MYTGEKKSLEFKFWNARFYQDENGDIRNKIRRGNGKRQQKDAIATVKTTNGYLSIDERINGKKIQVKAHRLAILLHTGKCPGDLEVNHKNQDKADNRIQNLEVVTRVEHMHKHPKQKNCTSGVTGVCWDKPNQKWRVQISINGKQTTIGCFADFDDAVKCRKAAEKEHGYFEEHGMTREEVQEYYKNKEAENQQR